MKYLSVINLARILLFVFICYAGANPTTTPARRTKRSSCRRNIQMICPTEKKHFVVHSSRKGRGCEFDEPIMVTALRDCDNSIMDTCKDRWEKKPNNCSAPVIKEVVDYAFQGSCFLHDLCYLAWNTTQKDCDDWFLHNMKQMCSIRGGWLTRSLCKGGAYIVYWAVRAFGGGKFDDAKSWTKENCSENCTARNPEVKWPTKCPRNISMVCPTTHERFVVHSSWCESDCKFDEPIMVTALRECNNSVMDVCKDEWEKKPNNCSAPVKKEIVDYAFQGACFLHDLCYLSRNTEQKDCDGWFLHNMKRMCSIRGNWLKRSLCKSGAYVVYAAVRGFGKSKYDAAKNWTIENCTSEVNPTKSPTSEDFGSGTGSGSGEPVLRDEQSTEQTELEQSDENSPKPKQTEPTQFPKQNEQLA